MPRGIRVLLLGLVLLGAMTAGRSSQVWSAQMEISKDASGTIVISTPKARPSPATPAKETAPRGTGGTATPGPNDNSPAPRKALDDKAEGKAGIPPQAMNEFDALQKQYEQRMDELQAQHDLLYGTYLARMEDLKSRKDGIEAQIEEISRVVIHHRFDRVRFEELQRQLRELEAYQTSINDDWNATLAELKTREQEINDWRKAELLRIIQKYNIPPERVQMP